MQTNTQMHVWYKSSTIFKIQTNLTFLGMFLICVVLITTLFLNSFANAAPGINQTLSFQGRLTNSSGGAVADGYYNMQFKIYQGGTGLLADNPSGTLKWTENHVNKSTESGIRVENGYFSVNLGSVNPFGSQINWNDDTLWLSMNIGDTSADCTTFTSCSPDGEMLPMKRITSVPFAINSALLGGKSAESFLQLAQGVQEDSSTNTSSIFINKTGTGSLMQLQNSSADVLTITQAGDIDFGSGSDHTISVHSSSSGLPGAGLTVVAGDGGSGSGSTGGDLVLQGGSGGGTDGSAGSIYIDGGAATGTGDTGSVNIGTVNPGDIQIGSATTSGNQTINIGNNDTSGSNTDVTIGSGGNATGGTTTIQSKDDTVVNTGGEQKARFSGDSNTLTLGNGDEDGNATTANAFTIQGTSSTGENVQGGSLVVQAGSAGAGNANGGNLTLSAGSGSGTGAYGLVIIDTPTFKTSSAQTCATNCAITQANIDGNGAISLTASASDLTITLNDPTITTAGRIIYITSTSDSNKFTLSMNGAADTMSVKPNSTVSLLWNGSDWTTTNSNSTSALQDLYDNSLQSSGKAEIVLNNGAAVNGLTISDSAVNPVDGSLLTVRDSNGNSLFAINQSVSGTSNIKVGSDTGTPVLLTVDTAASAPSVSSALLGSMYYDTTIGAIQCYEADGWGNCSDAPDSFISLSPSYPGMVTHGSDDGNLTEDICSGTLAINDGSSGQPTICTSNETYNYYAWNSTSTTTQTKSLFVTYKLPSSFKEFVEGSTSLEALTDSNDSTVTYQIYKNISGTGLSACGSSISVSSGVKSAWQSASSSGAGDPSACEFSAGDSIVFRIDLSTKNDNHAYVSNLSFAFTNNN